MQHYRQQTKKTTRPMQGKSPIIRYIYAQQKPLGSLPAARTVNPYSPRHPWRQ